MARASIRKAALKTMLMARRQELQDDVWNRIRDRRASGAHGVRDGVEESDAALQADVDHALLQMQEETLRRIDHALTRLDNGKYGDCYDCEEEISKQRLQALPFAVRCQACQSRREQAEAHTRRLDLRHGAFSLFSEGAGF